MIIVGAEGPIGEVHLHKGQVAITGRFESLPQITSGDNLGYIAIYGDDGELIHTTNDPFIANFNLDAGDSLSLTIGLDCYQQEEMERWILRK
jgi:hypothetical protein